MIVSSHFVRALEIFSRAFAEASALTGSARMHSTSARPAPVASPAAAT